MRTLFFYCNNFLEKIVQCTEDKTNSVITECCQEALMNVADEPVQVSWFIC